MGCVKRGLGEGTEDPALLFGAALVSSSIGGSVEGREKMMTKALAKSGPKLQKIMAAAYDHTTCKKSFEELLAASRNI